MSDEKKEELFFNPKSRLLLQLGDQLIKNEKVALSELVKNSYDACARYTIVSLSNVHLDNFRTKGKITIKDDGIGMNKDVVENIWMIPGTDNKEQIKKNFVEDENTCTRFPIGEKGIGRFGVHKLGYKIKLISKMNDSKEVEVNIDWRQFEKDSYLKDEKIELIERDTPKYFQNDSGTLLIIESIKKQWSETDIREVYRSIQALTSPFSSKDDFVVDFRVDEEKMIEDLFDPLTLPDINLWHFKCDFVSNKENKEKTEISNFSFSFTPYERMDRLKVPQREVSQLDKYIKDDKFIQEEVKKTLDGKEETVFEDLPLEGIGDCSFEGYIFDLDSKTLNLSSSIKDKAGLRKYLKENGGIRVYRDELRIYDYGEKENDWLDLNQSRVDDPSTSIGNNQILAAININMKTSNELVEKTNREGFIENKTYQNFKKIVKIVLDKIAFLRNEDKDKIRLLHLKEVDTVESAYSLINTIKSDIKKNVDDQKIQNKMITNLDKIQENYEEVKELLLKTSGSGLTYGIVTHQMQKIVSEIKHRVNDHTDEKLQDLVRSLNLTIESIMNLFIVSEKNIYDAVPFIKNQKNSFNYRFRKHKIEYIQAFSDEEKYNLYMAESFVAGSILNIIDNSIYWLERWYKTTNPNEDKKIRIDLKEDDTYTLIIISDNGLGFLINPETAVMPFKTTKGSKERGTGIGLYYVSEAMKINDGELYIPTLVEEKQKLEIPEEFFRGATVVLKLLKRDNNDL